MNTVDKKESMGDFKIIAIPKETGKFFSKQCLFSLTSPEVEIIDDLYWFEENYVHGLYNNSDYDFVVMIGDKTILDTRNSK